MRTLYYRFKTASEFIAKSLPDYPYGGLFVPGSRGIKERELVMLDITIEAVHGHYIFRAGVAKRDATFSDGGRERLGMELEFIGGDEIHIQALVDDLATAQGTFKPRKAGNRLPAAMDIKFSIGNRNIKAPVLDFGPGGFFMPDIPGVLPGDTLRCRMVSPEARIDQQTVVEVMWAGEKDGIQGLGARFVFDSKRDQRRWSSAYSALNGRSGGLIARLVP